MLGLCSTLTPPHRTDPLLLRLWISKDCRQVVNHLLLHLDQLNLASHVGSHLLHLYFRFRRYFLLIESQSINRKFIPLHFIEQLVAAAHRRTSVAPEGGFHVALAHAVIFHEPTENKFHRQFDYNAVASLG